MAALSVTLASLIAALAFIGQASGIVLGVENRCGFSVILDALPLDVGSGGYEERDIPFNLDTHVGPPNDLRDFRLLLRPNGNEAQYGIIGQLPILFDGQQAHEVALFPDPEERPDCPIANCQINLGCTAYPLTCPGGVDEYYNLVLCVDISDDDQPGDQERRHLGRRKHVEVAAGTRPRAS